MNFLPFSGIPNHECKKVKLENPLCGNCNNKRKKSEQAVDKLEEQILE